MEALSVVTACHLITKGAVGDVKARASARARQSDAARHAAIHAGRAGDRDGALFDSRHPARPGRRRLGNGEGEFPLVGALLCLTEAQRPGGVEV